MNRRQQTDRRGFMTHTSMAAAALSSGVLFTTPGRFADELLTPRQTEGPFYPDRLPLDTDNDLLIINDSITPAIGNITHLTGTVSDVKGNPLRNAVVEIWQCDGNGVYLHSADSGTKRGEKQDKNFQGFGRFTTNVKGEYYFRTIKPVPYPGRTPHIHFKVYTNGKPVLTTQMYINGHEQNARDGVMRTIPNAELRQLLFVDFKPLADSKIPKYPLKTKLGQRKLWPFFVPWLAAKKPIKFRS